MIDLKKIYEAIANDDEIKQLNKEKEEVLLNSRRIIVVDINDEEKNTIAEHIKDNTKTILISDIVEIKYDDESEKEIKQINDKIDKIINKYNINYSRSCKDE